MDPSGTKQRFSSKLGRAWLATSDMTFVWVFVDFPQVMKSMSDNQNKTIGFTTSKNQWGVCWQFWISLDEPMKKIKKIKTMHMHRAPCTNNWVAFRAVPFASRYPTLPHRNIRTCDLLVHNKISKATHTLDHKQGPCYAGYQNLPHSSQWMWMLTLVEAASYRHVRSHNLPLGIVVMQTAMLVCSL